MGDMTIGQVTAGGNADLVAMGACAQLMLVDAGGNANITSYGALIPPAVIAGGDADLFAMGPTVVDITASTNASVFSDDDVEANVVATADADVTSLGASLKAILNAGADALAYTAGAITASVINAGGERSMTALREIANSSVYGDEGAFAMAGSDMTLVNLVSANGPSDAISAGSIASGTLNASTDASLVTVGNVSTSSVTAGGGIFALTEGNLTGTDIDAGANVEIGSYGTIQLNNVLAGGNVVLSSVGDMDANVDAGGTLEALTFGDLDGVFEADDEILEIVALGNIPGTYTSHDNVDAVFGYGDIDAIIIGDGAGDPTDADGDDRGYVRNIAVRGNADITVIGAEHVGDIDVGGTATVSVTAPTTGDVTDNDRTGFSGWPEPRSLRIGNLTTRFVDMGRDSQSVSELLGIGRDSLDRQFDAAQEQMDSEWDRLNQELVELLTVESGEAGNQNAQLIRIASEVDDAADRWASDLNKDLLDMLQDWQTKEENTRGAVELEIVEAKHQADAGFQDASNYKVQSTDAATTFAGTMNAINDQVKGSLAASKGQATVVAAEWSRCLEVSSDEQTEVASSGSTGEGGFWAQAKSFFGGLLGPSIPTSEFRERWHELLGPSVPVDEATWLDLLGPRISVDTFRDDPSTVLGPCTRVSDLKEEIKSGEFAQKAGRAVIDAIMLEAGRASARRGRSLDPPSRDSAFDLSESAGAAKRAYKRPKMGAKVKIGSTDIPSWAEVQRPFVKEVGKDFAKRVMDERYGVDGWTRTGKRAREFSQLKKYCDRHLRTQVNGKRRIGTHILAACICENLPGFVQA